MERVVKGLTELRPNWRPFYDQHSLTAGYWMPQLAKGVEEAQAFLFLFGTRFGPWQTIEYYGAFDRRAKEPNLPIVPVVMGDASAPGLPFFPQLQWTQEPDPAAPEAIARMVSALERVKGQEARDLWRLVNPYRGLLALREEDASLLCGREALVGEFVNALASPSRKIIVAVGNSGVGKSSLIFAGIFAALSRQGWPRPWNEEWPASLNASRSWLRISMSPRDDPLKELARAFTVQWLDAREPDYHVAVDKWRSRLVSPESQIDELILASDAWAWEHGLDPPARYLLYIDQGEELYTRAEASSRARFVEILSEAARHERVRVLMSLRADFYGHLQDDVVLFPATARYDVPRLDEAGIRCVVTEPAAMFGAAFEDELADTLVASTLRQPLGLPLLSYQMDEIWRDMVSKGDGVLRWPRRGSASFDISTALVDRADRYVRAHDDRAAATRKLFCVRLIYVPNHGAPTRKVALQSQLSPAEREIAQDLAASEYRLLSTGEDDEGAPTIEIGHETLLMAWGTLSGWIGERRAFYSWLSLVEDMRRDWESAGRPPNALLTGRLLERAKSNRKAFPEELPDADAIYIEESEREQAASEARLAEQARKTRELEAIVAELRERVESASSLEQWSNEDRAYKYRAFITYSHHDESWAKYLQASLERFTVPSNVPVSLKGTGRSPRRIGVVFRDREELSASANIQEVVTQALKESAWLIVICTKRSANSRWVNAEIESFKRQGKGQRIIPVLVEETRDEPFEEYLPFALREDPPVAVDVRDGREVLVTKIAAAMLSIPFSQLYSRERRQRARRRALMLAALAVVIAAIVGAFVLGVAFRMR